MDEHVEEHVPVLVEEVLEGLAPRTGGLYVDNTFGRGGHTARLLEVIGPEGAVLALDRDPAAIDAGRRRFVDESRLTLVQADFAELARVIDQHSGGRQVFGVLLDLGVSSPQLDQPQRGFSFAKDGPLDMRMDPAHGESAAAWLARVDERELARVIYELSEERFSRRIAAAIVAARAKAPIERTAQLAAIVQHAIRTRDGKHPATRTFQAIRMFINDELGRLRKALDAAFAVLAPGGRLVVISFHSLEDRMVKQFIRTKSSVDPVFAGLPVIPDAARPVMREIGRKQRAADAEIARNPRARSAVLRCAEKMGGAA
ncbi:MAG: 16S rRNA (cytosine(1402)-N(4))-methyltransferase RsmH [Gammaproteobacteria bacterium]|nr:16S rRNA (cytosine(1402)-N(4))-methyltransferase RsmH [Gammaproteobacteria bacterium]